MFKLIMKLLFKLVIMWVMFMIMTGSMYYILQYGFGFNVNMDLYFPIISGILTIMLLWVD